jgi:protein-tyrosine phosphatase
VTISEGKVYNSGVIPPEKLPGILHKYNIRTVIDLRDGLVKTKFSPETTEQINEEENVISELTDIQYFNLPTGQIPKDSTIQKFLKIMDNPQNYPVLIHCHHGIGRSRLFSSIYRIEYENFTNDKARQKARFIWELSNNFSKKSEKGIFLINYKRTRNKENALNKINSK